MTETPVSPATPARSTTQRLGWILLLCVPAGLVIYFGWTQWYSLKHQVKTLQQEAASAAREQRAQNELWQTRLDGLTQEILQLKAADRTDWLLAETEYLLRLANQHAILGHDAPAAAALLAQADKVLLELTSPTEIQTMASLRKIIAIRQQIAEEREALLLRGDIDREGLYLQIEALIQQLDKIPVIDLESMSQNAAAAVMEEEKLFIPDSLGDRLMKSLRQALEKIGGYVRIQHHEQALNTLLSPVSSCTSNKICALCWSRPRLASCNTSKLFIPIACQKRNTG